MTTALFSSLYDEVLTEVVGVPQPVALNAIRSAAIEFCERSGVWTATHTPINSVANQAAYPFVPEAGTEVCGIFQAWYNGLKIIHRTSAQLESLVSTHGSTFVSGTPWTAQSGIPKYYTQDRPDEIILAPYPIEAIAAVLTMKVILRPTRAATGMEKWVLDKHFETIAHGAKLRLFSMVQKPWSSPEHAGFNNLKFEKGINDASVHTSQTQVLPEIVTSPSPI